MKKYIGTKTIMAMTMAKSEAAKTTIDFNNNEDE